MTWKVKAKGGGFKDFTEEMFKDFSHCEGFVYCIRNPHTMEWYIGKKSFHSRRKVAIGKRETEKIKEAKRLKGERAVAPKKKEVVKESNWRTYQSSNEKVKSWSYPTKIIMGIGTTKKHLTYLEERLLFKNDALEDEKCVNENIGGKYFKDEPFIKPL